MEEIRKIRMVGPYQRQAAHAMIEGAPAGWSCLIEPPARSLPQNRKLWAILGDLARANAGGHTYTPELWKDALMQALGFDIAYVQGLDGVPFAAGFSTKRLSVQQFSELIEFALERGTAWGVKWSDDYGGGNRT